MSVLVLGAPGRLDRLDSSSTLRRVQRYSWAFGDTITSIGEHQETATTSAHPEPEDAADSRPQERDCESQAPKRNWVTEAFPEPEGSLPATEENPATALGSPTAAPSVITNFSRTSKRQSLPPGAMQQGASIRVASVMRNPNKSSPVKRWDGATKTSTDWDGLRRVGIFQPWSDHNR